MQANFRFGADFYVLLGAVKRLGAAASQISGRRLALSTRRCYIWECWARYFEDGERFVAVQVAISSETGQIWVKLASSGVRPTRQRLELAEVLFGKGDRHFTAESVFVETRALRYPPSLGTIYNTLNQFVEHGLLREIALYDAKVWYDTNIGPHCHYFWEDTQQLSDIPDEHIPALSVPAPAGAKVTAIDVIVRVRASDAEPLPECPAAHFDLYLK